MSALASVLLAAAPLVAPCAATGTLAYVCEVQKPEDVLVIGDSGYLVASGYAPGAGLKLVDAQAHSASAWFTGSASQLAYDARAYPGCAEPPDPQLFSAHGLSLRWIAADRYRLHVVNHGGRESIEVFEVRLATGAAPTLQWQGCLPMPAGQIANSVATFRDGTVLATVLTRPGTRIADFVAGRNTGAVWAWRPGARAFRQLKGTELPGNNGLETDPDDRHFYVVAFGWHAVLVYDRRATAHPLRRITLPDFMPDNIHWTDGRLVAAGMRLDEPACGGLRRIVDGEADKMLCHRGYGVAQLDPVTGAVTSLAYGEPDAAFNGVSSAAIVGGTLWLGSYQADRLAYRPLPGR